VRGKEMMRKVKEKEGKIMRVHPSLKRGGYVTFYKRFKE
jgi:hypothetical protein